MEMTRNPHKWRAMKFPKATGIQNPDKTGLLVHCKHCDGVELVAPRCVPDFLALRACGREVVLSTPRNRLARRARVTRARAPAGSD